MIGTQLGPYTLRSKLGIGGMGTVYLATTAEEDGETRWAVKVVHPHLLATPGYFKRFLREAEAGRRVRHPNVVRTLDADAIDVDGRVVHYLVMEYVEGKTLRELSRALDVLPEAMLREIALQVAAGLAAIHDEGILHRDIKPENILITDDAEVRIMDHGVARLQDTTLTVSRAGQFAGSLLYGAPEQFGEEPPGPAADLYSLGVTLYELGTGEHPFRRDRQAAVIDAHLRHAPPPPAERRPDLSPFFSELVARLLAKQPSGRFASAEELRVTLAQGERSEWWTALEPVLRRAAEARPRIRVRRDTELYGRDDVLAALHRAWTDAAAGRGTVVLLEGEAGIGKTRVLDAFVHSLPDGSMHVLYGSYPPSAIGLGGISDAILGKFGEVGLADALAPYLQATPALAPAFAAVVTQSGPPPGRDAMGWDSLGTVCVNLMRALAEERPLLWLVDDLHFAPQESREIVLALARAVAGRRALLVATARPGLPEDELAELGRLESFVRVALRRLGAREVVQLLRSAFGSEALADKLGGTIAYRSDGVPFFIFEMIRSLEQGRFLKRQPDGSYVQSRAIEEIEVPSAVLDLIRGRLRKLDRGEREILDVGAVQGLRFDPALVAHVLEKKRVRVLQDLAQVERQTGLVHGAAGAVEFDQHQIQEVLYDNLLPDLRREYHRLLASAYAARLPAEPTGADSVFLATHHFRGSAPAHGLPFLWSALDELAATYRNEALIEIAGHALALEEGLDARARAEVLLRQASRLGFLGRHDREREVLAEAAAVADATGEPALRARVRVALAGHRNETSRFAEAIGAAERALDLAAAAGNRRLAAQAEGHLGRALMGLGRYGEARPHFERQLALALAIGRAGCEAVARGDLGLLLKAVGRYPDAREHFERQLALALESGDRQLEAAANGNLGTVCKAVGAFNEAQRFLERHGAIAREIGDRWGEASACGNLGLVLKNLGQLEKARSHFGRNLEISREIGNRVGEATALGNLGLIHKALGRYEDARAHFERSRALCREIGDRQGEAIATGNMGNVLLDLGQDEEALAHYEQWRAAARAMGDRRSEAVALGNMGNALDGLGRYAEARERFEQARDLTREIGDREGEGIALADLGALAGTLGDAERGKELAARSLAILAELGAPRSEAHALHVLGSLASQAGDVNEATRRFEAALAIRQETGPPSDEADTELACGKVLADHGRVGEAREHLERAAHMARTLRMPSVEVAAACALSAVTGEADEARTLLSRHEQGLRAAALADARFRLWRATGAADDLAAAHELAARLRAGAPEECRAPMAAKVPLHRDVQRASAQHG